ncbi:MAG: translation elongation factor Ts [Candidatus Hydrogenedentota bacterium]
MAEITAQIVKDLRERTGAGMMDCKKALGETKGNFEGAAKWLREKGIASAAKRDSRTAAEGAVASYIHMGGKIGVLVEVNCETDFVAKGEPFQEFIKDVCLQICSTAPRWVRRNEVTADVLEEEKSIYRKQALHSGKPANIVDKIADGKMNKFYEDNCLLEQKFVKNPDVTIESLMKELSGKVGEKVDIRRFVRYQLGEGIEKKQSNLAEEVAAAVAAAKGN